MNFIKQFNAFNDFARRTGLSSTEQIIYYKLFAVNNFSGWVEWFKATNHYLMIECNIKNENTFSLNRNKLQQIKLIEFVQGKKGSPTKYKLIKLYTDEIVVKSEVKTEVKDEVNVEVKTADIPKNKPKDKQNNKRKNIKKEKEHLFDFKQAIIDYSNGNIELQEALLDFVEVRKGRKAPQTEQAWKALFKILDSSDSDLGKIEIVNKSIASNYAGLFLDKKIAFSSKGGKRSIDELTRQRLERAGKLPASEVTIDV